MALPNWAARCLQLRPPVLWKFIAAKTEKWGKVIRAANICRARSVPPSPGRAFIRVRFPAILRKVPDMMPLLAEEFLPR
jgi:hypothetical protein